MFVEFGMLSSPSSTGKHDSSHRRFGKEATGRGRDKEDKGATSPRLTLKFQHIKTKENRGGNDSHTPQKASKHTGREGHYKSYSVTLASEESECKRAKYTPPLSPANSTSSQDSDLYDPKLDGIRYNSKSDSTKSVLYPRGRDTSHSSVFVNKMENTHHSSKENEKRPLAPVPDGGRLSQFEDISDEEDNKDSTTRKEEPMEVGSSTVSTSSGSPVGGPLSSSSSRLRVSPTPSRSTQPSSSTQHNTVTAPSLHIPPQHPSSLSHIPSSTTTTTAAQPISSISVTTSSAAASHMSRRPIYSQHKSAASDHTGGHHHHSVSSHSTHASSSSSSTSSSKSGGATHSGDSHKHHTPVYAPASSSSSSSGGSSAHHNTQHVSTSSSSSNLQQQQTTLSEQEKIRLDKQRESQRLYQFEDEFSDKEEPNRPLRPEKNSPKSTSDTNSSNLAKDSSKLSPKFDSIRDNKSPKSDTMRERLSPKYGADLKLFGTKLDKEQQHRTFPRIEREAKSDGKVSPKPERHSPKLDKEKENGRLTMLSSSVKPDSSSGNGNSSGNNRGSPKLDKDVVRLSPKSDGSNGSNGSGRSSPKVPPLKIILPVKTTAPTTDSGESLKSLLMKPALPYVLNPTQDGSASTTSGDPSSSLVPCTETTTTTSSSGESIVSCQTSSSTAATSGASGNEAKPIDIQPAQDKRVSPQGTPAADNNQSGASSTSDQSQRVW